MTRDGAFREDLLYRLIGDTIRIPPLRERREDVGPLARRFLQARGRDLAPRTVELLERQQWPGNVRQLEWTLARAAALTDALTLEPRHFRDELHEAVSRADLLGAKVPLAELAQRLGLPEVAVRRLILQAMAEEEARHGGARAAARAWSCVPSTWATRKGWRLQDPQSPSDEATHAGWSAPGAEEDGVA